MKLTCYNQAYLFLTEIIISIIPIFIKKQKMAIILSKKDLYTSNIIGVKIENQKRSYNQTIGDAPRIIDIRRTRYLKICWMCGSPYESNRVNSFACSTRCSQNIWHHRQMGINPPARMDQLTKEKHVKEAKERYGYL